MKKIVSIILGLICLVSLNSCLKDQGYEDSQYGLKPTDVNSQPFVQILGGGLAKFNNQLIVPIVTNARDTVSFKIFYVNNGKPADKDIKITLAVNPAALVTYNANPATPDFVILPDSTYSFPVKTATVKAGESYSEDIKVIYFPGKINSSQLYMLPISIVDAQGVNISSNNGTTFYHIIGNPLAGSYSVVGTRYNYTGAVTFDGVPANIPTPVSTTAIPSPKTANAVDGDIISMDFSNLGASSGFNFKYILTQQNNFANINVGYNTEFTTGNSAIKTYLISYISPIGQKAKFRIITHYNNNPAGGGNDRIIDELFTQL